MGKGVEVNLPNVVSRSNPLCTVDFDFGGCFLASPGPCINAAVPSLPLLLRLHHLCPLRLTLKLWRRRSRKVSHHGRQAWSMSILLSRGAIELCLT